VQARRPTLEEVRRSYTPDKRWSELEGDLPSFLLFRPLSIWLTPWCVAAGITPTAITLLSALLTCFLPLVAVSNHREAGLLIALLAFVIHVLDCLDGNIARTARQESRFGALLDGFVDVCFWTLYLLSIGILSATSSPAWLRPHAVAVALGLSLLVLLHRQLRDDYATIYGERAEFRSQPPARLTVFDLFWVALIGLERCYFIGVLIGWWRDDMGWVLIMIGAYVIAIFVGAVYLTLRKAWLRGAA